MEKVAVSPHDGDKNAITHWINPKKRKGGVSVTLWSGFVTLRGETELTVSEKRILMRC